MDDAMRADAELRLRQAYAACAGSDAVSIDPTIILLLLRIALAALQFCRERSSTPEGDALLLIEQHPVAARFRLRRHLRAHQDGLKALGIDDDDAMTAILSAASTMAPAQLMRL